MNSQDWTLNAYDISSTQSLLFCDKQTQTSNLHLISSKTSSSRPVPMNIEASKNDNVKVYEYCEVIPDPDDPDSVSIVKETFTEEVIKESDSFFGKPISNKYKYCKEIIQPFSKSFPDNCSTCKSFIDKTCKPKANDCEDPCEQPIEDIISDNKEETDNKNMDLDKGKSTFVNPNCPTNTDKPDAKKSSCSSIESMNKGGKSPCKKQSQVTCQKAKEPFDEGNLKKCISSCINESLKLAKKQSISCMEKLEKVIGVKQPKSDEKPTFYVMEKTKPDKECTDINIPKKSSYQNVIDSQSQTVATVTCAIKGFFDSVYNKTKEAVNMIRTESCRHLGIGEEPKPTHNATVSDQKTKDCSSTSLETNIQSVIETVTGQSSSIDQENNNENPSLDQVLEPAKEVIGQVASVVASTVSVLKKSSFDQIAEKILNSKMNKSSPYDIPDISKAPPKEVAQEREPNPQPSVFTIIRTKLFSMFSENQQECTDSDDNTDDNDENTAEKLFDKYCEQ